MKGATVIAGEAAFPIEMDEKSVTFSCPSNLPWVGQAVETCMEFLGQHGFSQPAGPTLVLRELLVNAMKHGNQCDHRRHVHVVIEYDGGARFRLTVEDEGEGFDYESITAQAGAEAVYPSRRGYALIQTLSDRLEFNDIGNRVTAQVRV